jgi:hypothetical protein
MFFGMPEHMAKNAISQFICIFVFSDLLDKFWKKRLCEKSFSQFYRFANHFYISEHSGPNFKEPLIIFRYRNTVGTFLENR